MNSKNVTFTARSFDRQWTIGIIVILYAMNYEPPYMCARTSQLYWTTITFDGALQNVVSMSDIPIRNYIGTL